MIGLTMVLLILLYGVLAWKVASLLGHQASPGGSRPITLIAFVLLSLLPFVDEVVGRFQFQHECKKIQGYSITEAIKTSRMARYAEGAPDMTLPAVMPITRRSATVVDSQSGAVLMSYQTISTPGGWLMRAGLNMGDASFCNAVDAPKVMAQHGFDLITNGFFERAAGR